MFDVFSFVCGQTLGSMERTLEPEGYFCDVGISALNRGTAPVRLDPFEQRLLVDGQPLRPWEEAMRELVLNEPDNLFVQEIPPGGGGTASLIFELPDGATPERLELHASPDSAGADVRLTGCRLWKVATPGPCALGQRGNVRGTAYPREAAVGVSYPISFHFDEGMGLCFEGRDWEVQPTDADLARLDGHGVITLRSPELAELRDNSGVVVRLMPSAANDGDAAVCG
jgi:catechol 2,3-dioxygenase-like lactoylglutathione lyase family enzyme